MPNNIAYAKSISNIKLLLISSIESVYMKVSNILNIRNSKIRIFPFQTRDTSFILYPDLPTSYLLGLLVDKIGFQLQQFVFEYVYPTNTCVKKIISEIENYKEEYFIFYLENYFHSSDYALGFLEKILEKISKLEKQPFIIIHTTKAPREDIKRVIEKYECILLVVNWDFEDYFYQQFFLHKNIINIWNIYFRDDDWNVIINKNIDVTWDLNLFIWPAYANWYYTYFSKNKDSIIAILDEDDSKTDESIYYRRSKNTKIKSFRYSAWTEIMLTTGRGCKYKCSYCFRWAKYSTVRKISLATLKKDLDYLEELKYSYIYFYDDCFITTNLDRLDDILRLLSNYSFEYGISARFEVCTPKNLILLSQLNIQRIQIWLQSISLEVNKETKRVFNKAAFEKTIKKMQWFWISISLDIILGLPWEWMKWFIQTFNYAMSLQPISIFINSLFLNPGTELHEKKWEYWIITNKVDSKWQLFHVSAMKSSNDFTQKEVQIARKYVWYYIEKMKNINIVLR